MKTGADALGTTEKECGCAKHENGTRHPRHRRRRVRGRKTKKREPTPSIPPKTSHGVQNMKTGPDALGIAENESGSENMKTGLDAIGTAENESGRAKHENGT
jgi:hypothetical protein